MLIMQGSNGRGRHWTSDALYLPFQGTVYSSLYLGRDKLQHTCNWMELYCLCLLLADWLSTLWWWEIRLCLRGFSSMEWSVSPITLLTVSSVCFTSSSSREKVAVDELGWRIMNFTRVARSSLCFMQFPLCIFHMVILSLHWGKTLNRSSAQSDPVRHTRHMGVMCNHIWLLPWQPQQHLLMDGRV